MPPKKKPAGHFHGGSLGPRGPYKLTKGKNDGRRNNGGRRGNKGGRGSKGPRGPYKPRHKNSPKPRKARKKFCFKDYFIQGLDLSLARQAVTMQQWTDEVTVRRLLQILERGSGGMSFGTYHHDAPDSGRLLLDWPAPLHVNRAFRACIFWPQRERYSDVDMSDAHHHISIYKARELGAGHHEMSEYLQTKKEKHKELLCQCLAKQDVKQLWHCLLNSGAVFGWKKDLVSKYGGVTVHISKKLMSHLTAFRSEVQEVRKCALKGANCHFVGKMKTSKKQQEKLKRKAWNRILTSFESQLMKELEILVARTSGGTVQACMPSYDGLLLHHDNPIRQEQDIDDFKKAWECHCLAKYGYHFPIQKKPWDEVVPGWVKLLS